jgi:hypothetical protein
MGSCPFGLNAPRPFSKPFVPHNLMSKSCEVFSFTKVPDCPKTSTSNILWVQEKGAQIDVSEGSQGFTLTQNIG